MRNFFLAVIYLLSWWMLHVSGLFLLPDRLKVPLMNKHSCSYRMATKTRAESIGSSTEFEDFIHDNDYVIDTILKQRYACSRFQRFSPASPLTSSNSTVIQLALDALDVARRAPSGFNVQPYKIILVTSSEQKAAIAKYCAGRNADRVRDSDCTAVFLADQESGRNFRKYQSLLNSNTYKDDNDCNVWKGWKFWKLQGIIALFSSAYPLPRIVRVPLSLCVRLAVSFVNIFLGRWIVIPSLSSAETWATKNTMLVAASYMIACTGRRLATCPMEGINGPGIKRALKIPRRYAVSLVVATGHAYNEEAKENIKIEETDDVGISHGKPGSMEQTRRYPRKEVIYNNIFGDPA